MADSYLINQCSSSSSNYFPIVFLFFKQLKKRSRLRILDAQYHTCKQRRRVGNPFRNRFFYFCVRQSDLSRKKYSGRYLSAVYYTSFGTHGCLSLKSKRTKDPRWENWFASTIFPRFRSWNTLIENRTRNFVFLNESQPPIISAANFI